MAPVIPDLTVLRGAAKHYSDTTERLLK
jgi:hypothetical protein